MKKFLIALLISAGSLGAGNAEAQVNVNINLGAQPAWAPIGYNNVNYYYLPDIETYYDVNRRVYIYPERGRWVPARTLPPRFSNYNVYNRYKVVLNGVRDPWNQHTVYRQRYIGYRNRPSQVIIRDAPDRRYWVNPGNKYHAKYKAEKGNSGKTYVRQVKSDNGNHYGHYKNGKAASNFKAAGNGNGGGKGPGNKGGNGNGNGNGNGKGKGKGK